MNSCIAARKITEGTALIINPMNAIVQGLVFSAQLLLLGPKRGDVCTICTHAGYYKPSETDQRERAFYNSV